MESPSINWRTEPRASPDAPFPFSPSPLFQNVTIGHSPGGFGGGQGALKTPCAPRSLNPVHIREITMRKIVGVGVAFGAMLCFMGTVIAAEQPHMEATLQLLENAKHEIEIADQFKDHGGHAGEATRLINEAIHEVREGIRYRDEHGK